MELTRVELPSLRHNRHGTDGNKCQLLGLEYGSNLYCEPVGSNLYCEPVIADPTFAVNPSLRSPTGFTKGSNLYCEPVIADPTLM